MKYPHTQVIHTTISSGYSVTSAFNLAGARGVAIAFPLVTSCIAYLQFAATESGSFQTATVRDNAADSLASISIANGNAVHVMQSQIVGFPYVRISTGVAQADTRSIAILIGR